MRIRTIKPEFWKSERMCGLGAEARLLALGLLNYADDEGYFLAHPALIRGELMPFAESTQGVAGLLEALVEIEYLRIGEDEKGRRIGLVVNFKKHQMVNRPQRSKLAGLVVFPNWSPVIPGILSEGSGSDQGGITDVSVMDQGGINGGMDQGSGIRDQGSGIRDQGMEGIKEGSGEDGLDEPGGGVAEAGSSMREGGSNAEDVSLAQKEAEPDADSVIPDSAEPAKKKKGGAGRGIEGPPPNWRGVWGELFGPLPCPELWEGVLDVARRQIVARIEEKKEGPQGLASSSCPVPGALLAQVWSVIEPRTRGVEQLKVDLGREYVCFAASPSGWEVTNHSLGGVCFVGSCMRRAVLQRLLVELVGGEPSLKKAALPRKRDELFDAVARVCGMVPAEVTKSAGGEIGKALSEIKGVCAGVTVAEIERRAGAYRREWPNATLSASALAKHWGRFGGGGKKEGAGRGTDAIAEPGWDWREVAAGLQMPVGVSEPWARLDRAWQVRVLRAKKENGGAGL